MAAATAALIAATVVAAGSAGYNAYQASQAKSEAIDEKGKQEALAAEQLRIADEKKKQDKAMLDKKVAEQEAERASNAKRLQDQALKNSRAGYGGRRKGGTLLTGPLGIQDGGTGGTTTTGTKTLLGS